MLYQRPNSPFWWVALGRNFRESTKVPHNGRERAPREAKDYERACKDRLRARRSGQRLTLSFREGAAAWLNSDAKARGRDRQCLKWLMENPAPAAPVLGAYDCNDVADADVLERVRKLGLKAGWKHSTVDRVMGTVAAVLNHAYTLHALTAEPVVPLYNPVVDEPRYFTREEFGRLMVQLPEHLQLAAAFAVATLLRMRAMLSIRKADIDLERGQAFIRKRNQKGQMKTFAFPLSSDALAIVRRLFELNPGGEWLFQWKGKRIDDCNTASYRKALQRAGLGWANWHTLRHTGATWARHAGAQDGTLMDLGGWADMRMVKRYAHHGGLPAHVRAASEAIAVGAVAGFLRPPAPPAGDGGAGGDRTRGLRIANASLSQLSYSPPANHGVAQMSHTGGGTVGAEDPENTDISSVLAFRLQPTSAALRRLPHIKKSKP